MTYPRGRCIRRRHDGDRRSCHIPSWPRWALRRWRTCRRNHSTHPAGSVSRTQYRAPLTAVRAAWRVKGTNAAISGDLVSNRPLTSAIWRELLTRSANPPIVSLFDFLGLTHKCAVTAGEVHGACQEDEEAPEAVLQRDHRMVPRTSPRPRGKAASRPQRETSRPLSGLRPPHELPQSVAVLSRRPVRLEEVTWSEIKSFIAIRRPCVVAANLA